MKNTLTKTLGALFAAKLIALAFLIPVHAAKVVPSIRIEIPSDKKGSAPNDEAAPEIKNAPSILLDDDSEKKLVPDELEGIAPDDFELEDSVEEPFEEEKRGPVQVFYGDDDLPDAVRDTRKKLLDAATTGDIEKLRPIIESFTEQPILSFDEEEDPIEVLKAASGDGEGREILAILIEVLQSGYVRRDEGDDGDVYIWPYFVEIPPEDLKPDQIVELFHVITAGDFEDMKAYGTYIFYRAGITPDGELKFFVAGD